MGSAATARIVAPPAISELNTPITAGGLVATTTVTERAGALPAGRRRTLRDPRFEHVFFSGMAALILAAVLLGFAQTFYLRGILHIPHFKAFAARPLPAVVYIHGTIFSLWILLLLAQTSLVAARRVDLHRRLGILGFSFACLLVLAGVAVVCEQLANSQPGAPTIAGTARQVLRVVSFAVLVYFGYRQRRNPAVHKRLMLIATINLLPAAIVRWPVITAGNFGLTLLLCCALLALVVCYDLLSTRRVYRATLWGIAASFAVNPPIVAAFVQNRAWFQLAASMQTLGRLAHLSWRF